MKTNYSDLKFRLLADRLRPSHPRAFFSPFWGFRPFLPVHFTVALFWPVNCFENDRTYDEETVSRRATNV